MSDELKNPETIALHAGWRSDASTNSVAVPIHQTTSYQFDNTEHAANLFALSEFCLLYTSPSPRDISGSRMPSSA